MKKSLFNFSLLLSQFAFTFSGSAQITFQKLYDYGEAYPVDILQSADNGYYISGSVSNGLFGAAAIMKTDSLGTFEFANRYQFSTSDFQNNRLLQCPDHSFIVAGQYYNSSQYIYSILKVDSNLNVLWNKQYDIAPYMLFNIQYNGFSDGEFSMGAVLCTDGSFMVSGFLFDTVLNTYYHHVMKLDSTGGVIWSNLYNQNIKEYLHDMQLARISEPAGEGIIICADGTDSLGISGDNAWLTLIDNNGNVVWSYLYGSDYLTGGYQVTQTSDNGFVITGLKEEFNNGKILLFKINNNGAVIWSKSYDHGSYCWANSVAQTTDGGFIVAGVMIDTINSLKHSLLLKTDSTGTPEWSKVYYGSNSTFARKVIQTRDGGYTFCGTNPDIFNIPNKMYVVKTDASGNSGCMDSTMNFTTVTENLSPYVWGSKTGFAIVPGSLTPNVISINPAQTIICLDNEISESDFINHPGIFPNPTTGNITLNTSALTSSSFTITLSDAVGKIIMVKNFQLPAMELTLDLSGLNNGIYLIHIDDGNGGFTQKVVLYK